jgi:Protein of unknown function (DUF2510)
MDRAGGGSTRRYERRLERALAHPWQASAKFGFVYSATWITLQLLQGKPVVDTLVVDGVTFAILSLILGLSLRGGWVRHSYQRRLDRLRELMTAPPTGWYPDPSGRHEFRFWTGQRWTDFALDNGVQCADPLREP